MEPNGPSKVMDPYADASGEWLSNEPGHIAKLYHIIGTEETPSRFFEVGLYVVLPGESVPVHEHAAGEEFAYMLRGEALLISENDAVIGRVRERKIVYVPAGALHGYMNYSEDPIEILVWTTKNAGLHC